MIAQSKGWYRSVLTAAAVTAAAVQTSHTAAFVLPHSTSSQNAVSSSRLIHASTADSNPHYPQPSSSDRAPKLDGEERNDHSRVVYQLNESIEPSNNATTVSSTVDDSVASKVLEKKIRVAKAQAEIDRILSQPEGAPFDVETEMKKVISIAPLPSLDVAIPKDASSATAMLERLEQDLLVRHEDAAASDIERALYDAVRRQDFTTAAQQRALLDQQHLDDSLAALQCNAAFYKAFSQKDAAAMERLWLQDDSVVCIHPSHAPIVSAKNVNAAWQQMFGSSGSGAGSFQRMWIEPRQIRVSVRGHVALVTCDEHIFLRRFVRGQKRQTECINRLTATNVFRQVGARWYMVHHHAAWHAESEAAQQALARSSGVSSSYLQSLKRRQEATERENNSGWEGILGLNDFGPLLGSGSKKLQSDSAATPPARRIVMGTGSLSDILNGNLEDLLRGSGKSSDASSKDDGAAIIQFHRIESSEDDDDEDEELDDDDEEDDDEVEAVEIELNGGDHGSKEAFSIIKEWAETRGKPSKASTSVDVSKKASSKGAKEEPAVEVDQRSKCLSVIRQLCQQGLISSKQKRVLLSDMIASAARKEPSLIQVAYEFLFDSDDVDSDMAEEEFADQCRRIAESLPDV